jgi:F0F1-type ATP synthase assembly protein I
MKNDTTKQKLLRILILLVMFSAIVFSVSYAITNWEKGFAGFMLLFTILPTALYGLYLFFPRKNK